MKLLKTDVRVNPRDSLGQGMDSVMVLVLFFGAGFFADRWLGTTPWLMIVLTVLGSVGVFYKLKAGYIDRMDQLDAARVAAKRARQDAAAETALGTAADDRAAGERVEHTDPSAGAATP